jgi:hypothetical protein
MRALNTNPNVDNSDLVNYPLGRIKNNTGSGNGTPVNERVYGDIHQTIAKMMRLYNILPNNLPDNETNGFQIIESIVALASKNDFILPLSLNSGILSIPIKLGFMLTGEQLVCKALFDLGTETQIKGSDNVTFAFSANGSFQTNEYVRLIKTSGGVELIRLVDNVSLDSMVTDLTFLKKATQAQENAGVIDTKATTPLTNLVAFTKRVIGLDSGSYLATLIRNGLYNTEHFALVEELKKNKNNGWFGSVNVGDPIGTTYSVNGNCVSAVSVDSGQPNNSQIEITMQNAMPNLNYYVRLHIQSMGSINLDNDIYSPVFSPISTTKFQIAIAEPIDTSKALRFHFEAIQI